MQSTEIKEYAVTLVRTTNDIYGRDRLESLLSNNPVIEEKFFKLWITSTNVLKRILNNAAITNSNFIGNIFFKTKRYLMTDNFSRAVNMLLDNEF